MSKSKKKVSAKEIYDYVCNVLAKESAKEIDDYVRNVLAKNGMGDIPVDTGLAIHKYEKQNDLAVYVQCVERLGQLASIMNVYPKTMTLEQVKESVEYQLEKYRKLVIGQ